MPTSPSPGAGGVEVLEHARRRVGEEVSEGAVPAGAARLDGEGEIARNLMHLHQAVAGGGQHN